MGRRRTILALTASAVACLALICGAAACSPASGPSTAGALSSSPSATAAAGAPAGRATVTIVGTNDLHGRVHALPLLSGYVSRLRELRKDDGGVVLVDGGDMFQGTLESNLAEGLPVVAAYAAMGYDAVTVGNHEFDFGPAGPAATPRDPSDDPRGALKAAAAAAPFPFLAANVLDAATKQPVDWPNIEPSAMVTVGGAKVGLIGVTTIETLTTTISANVKGLEIAPLGDTIAKQAASLRRAGAAAVVVLAHAGGKCKAFTGNASTDGCDERAEIFRLARELPRGTIDVIVAGHTHAGVAHEVEGVAIIEQHSYGRAFGRVDLVIEAGAVVDRRIHPPRDLCPGIDKPDFDLCDPGEYEGVKIARDARVAAAVAPAIDGARAKRAELVGTDLPEGLRRAYDDESPLGNLFADLLRESRPNVDVGLMNGGGLRADLPRGALKYGSLFEAFPFDNQVAITEMDGRSFRQVVRGHLERGGGILSFSGVLVKAACKKGVLWVDLEKNGKPVKDDDLLVVAGSDFLFTGGDNFWGDVKPPHVAVLDELMRDALERGFKKRASIAPTTVFDPKKPRLSLSARRPIKCTTN